MKSLLVLASFEPFAIFAMTLQAWLMVSGDKFLAFETCWPYPALRFGLLHSIHGVVAPPRGKGRP